MAIKHPTIKVPGNTLAAVADWNADHVVDGNTGEVLFLTAGGNVSTDANFFWDNTNKRLGIGTAIPSKDLDVNGDVNITGILTTEGNVYLGNATFEQVFAQAGTNNIVSYSFAGDGNTGMYSSASDLLGLSAGGIEFIRLRETTQDILVFNEFSSDIDFRIESDTIENAFFLEGSSGNIGLGTITPATSAQLDMTSTTGALLLPRMTTAQRDALTAINGMLIYNSTLNKFQGYENGAWVSLI